MKTSYFSFALLMTFSVAFSQNKDTTFNSKEIISLTLFDTNTTEAVEINSLQTLGKTAWNNSFDTAKINLSPKEFNNWYTDSKRIESVKNMISTVQRQDICGRDLPTIDIHSEVIQNVYNRNLYGR